MENLLTENKNKLNYKCDTIFGCFDVSAEKIEKEIAPNNKTPHILFEVSSPFMKKDWCFESAGLKARLTQFIEWIN